MPFYRRALPARIQSSLATIEDIVELPFTTKDDLREAYPFGMLAVDRWSSCGYTPPQFPSCPQGRVSLALSARFGKDALPIGGGLTWQVKGEKPDTNGNFKLVKERKPPTPTLVLPAGTYIVHVGFGLATAVKPIDLRGTTVHEEFELQAGGLRIEGKVGDVRIPGSPHPFDVYRGSQFEAGDRRPIAEHVTTSDVDRGAGGDVLHRVDSGDARFRRGRSGFVVRCAGGARRTAPPAKSTSPRRPRWRPSSAAPATGRATRPGTASSPTMKPQRSWCAAAQRLTGKRHAEPSFNTTDEVVYSARMRLCVFCGSSPGRSPPTPPRRAVSARSLARRGIGLVYGGGNVGLMGIVADAVARRRRRGRSASSRARSSTASSRTPALTELHVVDTMHERKALMDDSPTASSRCRAASARSTSCSRRSPGAARHAPKAVRPLDVDDFWAPLRALVERQVAEEFVRSHHAMMLLHNNHPEALLDAFAAYRAPAVTKWIGRRDA